MTTGNGQPLPDLPKMASAKDCHRTLAFVVFAKSLKEMFLVLSLPKIEVFFLDFSFSKFFRVDIRQRKSTEQLNHKKYINGLKRYDVTNPKEFVGLPIFSGLYCFCRMHSFSGHEYKSTKVVTGLRSLKRRLARISY